MNIVNRLKNLTTKRSRGAHDYHVEPAVVAGGVIATTSTIGLIGGIRYGRERFEPGELTTVTGTRFVKTGTEHYMGTCHASSSGSMESFSFDCPKVRDVGYYENYTYKADARSHHAVNGAIAGATVGVAGIVVAAVLARVLEA